MLPHAWLAGALSIPAGNDWIPDAELDVPRPRTFGRLLYRDRSRPANHVGLEEREEMRRLDPELFQRFMRECGRRECAETPRLRW